jgi:hypothetical protein
MGEKGGRAKGAYEWKVLVDIGVHEVEILHVPLPVLTPSSPGYPRDCCEWQGAHGVAPALRHCQRGCLETAARHIWPSLLEVRHRKVMMQDSTDAGLGPLVT